jgi:hypothetical protein
VSCSEPASFTSWKFLLIAACAILIAAAVGFVLISKNVISIESIPSMPSLNLKNQIRFKQTAALFQMLTLLVALSLGFPSWLKTIASFLDSLSLPITVNTPCIPGLGGIARWQRGLLTFLCLSAAISLLLFAKPVFARVRCLPRISTKHFASMQILASILVTQSVAVLLPMTFDVDELSSEAVAVVNIEMKSRQSGAESLELMFTIAASVATIVFISASVVILVEHAHVKYLTVRMSFFENEDREMSQEEEVDALLPFWSTFCLSYVPRSANFESKVIRHRILCFVLPSLCRTASTYNMMLYALSGDGEYASNVPLVGACLEALCFVLLNTLYLRQQLRRPFISPRLDAVHGDPLNNAEILATRVLSWGATLFCLRLVLAEKLNYDLALLVPCLAVALLGALTFSQRSLFRGLVDDARSTLGSFSGGERSASVDVTSAAEGSNSSPRGISVLRDAGMNRTIEEMLDCDDTVEMWKLQKSLRGALLVESEKPRWVIEELGKTKGGLRRAGALLGSIVGAAVLSAVLFFLITFFATTDSGPIVLVVLLVGSSVAMEVFTARNLAAAGVEANVTEEREMVNESAGAGVGGAGGEIELTAQVEEMETVESPVIIDMPAVVVSGTEA